MRYKKNVPIEQLNIYVREYLVQNSLDENWMNLQNIHKSTHQFMVILAHHTVSYNETYIIFFQYTEKPI